MDRNQATGLILFAAVLLIYSFFFSSPEPVTDEQSTTSTEVQDDSASKQTAEPSTPALPDSVKNLQNQQQFGEFSSLVEGKEESVVLENELVKITFSSKGGEIKSVELKNYKTWAKQPLILMDEQSASIDYQIQTNKGPMSLNQFYFVGEKSTVTVDETPAQQLTFKATTASGSITRTYTLPDGKYVVDQQIKTNGLSSLSDQHINVLWEDRLKKQEADISESRRKTYVNFYTTEGDYDYLSASSDEDAERPSEPIKWVAFKQRFFTAGIIAPDQFTEVSLEQTVPTDTMSVKNMTASLSLPLENGQASNSYYFGPNNYKILKKVTPDFEKNVDMGYFFVSWVNKYIIVNLFHYLEKIISNYGVIIILIVFIIKLFLFPLTYKSYIGMAKMRVIKPEIDELKEKYPDDPTKQQQEQMKLFSQLGVSPISGCLPMILQMPFLFAMFFFFPNSIELRQESFLWAHDLSTYDSIINLPFTIPFYGSHVSLFTLLMTVSQIVYTRFNNQLTAAQGPMKNLGYIMPVTFMFVLNSYPAALSFYYFVSNMVTFGQQAIIKRFVDDDKIREKIEKNKKKNANKKKSKFQQRLEDAMKAAEANKKKK
ncbi:membrane protein insertase YidC [Echinicola vietnamensis]|uniref:Membrane protein insertase YidC n=1 Tax=Echinicola vietnamensis (strain DSM 17526 / LMG 23754 / KMM 6221) TaxID=926556 RepID=L0FZC5_ECHVK|nr:membrane protein insertase YidC [Echinicola vietnamensis]AGA78647.1 membrane protein insertase, YidC/Oxa1 family, N-terminal domain protein [Echinicola vietnamensis DSM 17526]